MTIDSDLEENTEEFDVVSLIYRVIADRGMKGRRKDGPLNCTGRDAECRAEEAALGRVSC